MPTDERKPSSANDPDSSRGVGEAAASSYTLIGAIILLGGAGYGLDRWAGTTPWGLFGGLALGIAVGFYELIKSTRRKS
jgi:ATP synthase protein I